MATTASPGRRFFGDVWSPKSFHGSASSSLKTHSSKDRKKVVLTMPSLLGIRRETQGVESDIRCRINDEDSSTTGPDVIASQELPPASQIEGSHFSTDNNVDEQNGYAHAQMPHSKSRTIIQLISMKFRSHLPLYSSPLSFLSSPSRVFSPDFTLKGEREAALRERGLLPPLRSNKDLSHIEREQDQRLPTLTPPPTDEEVLVMDSGTKVKISAASLVKQQWEAKNKSKLDEISQRERMSNFKFGGLPPPISSMNEETPLQDDIDISHKTDTPILSPNTVQNNAPNPIEPHSDPYRVPLPPSPLPSLRILLNPPANEIEASTMYAHATSVPPPPPSPNVLCTPHFIQSTTFPTISHPPPENLTTITDGTSGLPDKHFRPGSEFPTPTSLHAPSPITDIQASVRIQTNDIPSIIENPVEENSIKGSLTDLNTVGEPIQSKADNCNSAWMRSRGLSDPTASKANRRKSFNPFKRTQTTDPSSSSRSPVAEKRLSWSTPLTNMRRSVISTLSRPKSMLKVDTTFDAFHLPPSPTLPAGFQVPARSPVSSPRASPGTPLLSTPRLPVSPTLYSRGSILIEASHIEDEESRRVTELAFLG